MNRERIKSIQKRLGFTAEQMAQALGVTRVGYESWIYRVGNPSPLHVKALENLEAHADREEFKAQLTSLMVGGAFIAFAYLLDPDNIAHKRSNPSKPKRASRHPLND